MSIVSNFKKFVVESEDAAAELRAMGFKSDLPFEDRLGAAMDEWYADEEVQAAIQKLSDRADQLMEKHEIYFSDPEDKHEWDQRISWVYDNGIDEVGWFEFVTMASV